MIDEREAGWPHFLCGIPVFVGNVLERKTDDGSQRGRYEWSFVQSDAPTFDVDEGTINLSAKDTFRWPQENRVGIFGGQFD